jgi:nuclease HARBI1
VAKWPGSVHDCRIFRNCGLSVRFENGLYNGYLLGDTGYALQPYLMVPFRKPATQPQKRFNIAHRRTRVVVEQTFGQWKRRFHCLHAEIRFPDPEFICQVITVCAVLHNIAKTRNLPENFDDQDIPEENNDDVADDENNEPIPGGQAIRMSVVMNYFT